MEPSTSTSEATSPSTSKIAILTFIVGALAGSFAVWGLFFFKKVEVSTMSSRALGQTLASLPACIERDSVPSGDKLMTYVISRNTATIPLLKKIVPSLAQDVKDVYEQELRRQEKELVLYQEIYEELYKQPYEPSREELADVRTPFSSDLSTYSDNQYVGILRGFMEYSKREYYTFALVSENEKIRKNAEAFIEYKGKLDAVLTSLQVSTANVGATGATE